MTVKQMQEAHDAATASVSEGLARVEALLQSNRFILGEQLTECDVFLFPTAVRFDAAYAVLFR
jgi:glutathionyl-hydroquinone reductase